MASSVVTPPMPEASATPSRSGSSPESSRPASAHACVGGDHGELAGAVETAGLDPLEDLGRLDRDAAADLDRQLVDPVVGEVPDAGRAGQQGLPGGGDVPADGGGGAEAGDDYAGRGHLMWFRSRWG